MARRLGKPFMPWQQYVSDVILEIDPVTGLLVYDEYGMRVPRQSGKSTWVEAKSAHRCSATGFFGPRQHVVYTAQTRQKAREKWEEDFLFDLLASPAFKSRVRPHLRNGNEHIRFPNGSRWGLEAATEKAGHGPTIDNADIDEAFAHQDWRLEQAFGPAMITRLNKQLGWISTAGWLGGSPYLEEKSRIGQAAVLAGRRRGLAYFDWSAPDDADPGDEAVWWECMPALGHTISVEAVRAEYRKALDRGKLNEFRRAYLNQWVPKDAPDAWQKFSEAVWKARADRGSRIAGRVALGFAVAPDRSSAAVAAGGRRADGLGHGELVDHRDGTGWLVGRLLELADRWDPCVLAMNPAGAAGAFEKALAEHGFGPWKRVVDLPTGRWVTVNPRGCPLQVTGMREYAQACGALANDVVNGTWRHLGQGPLDAAAGSAGTRPLADAWAWSWKHSAADISPLEAVTLARHGFATHGVNAPSEPEIF